MGGAPETAAWAPAVTPATLSIQPTATDARQVLVFKGAGWQTAVVHVEISLRNISSHPSHRS